MSDKSWSNLPFWLPKKIRAIGLTVEETANRTGVSRTMVYDYLTDAKRPSEDAALRLSRVLGVTFEEILQQYVPKPRGRPRGGGATQELKVRQDKTRLRMQYLRVKGKRD